MNKKIRIFGTLAMAALMFGSCSEQTPELFQDIHGVYLNNRSKTNILQDATDVTFVYQKGDEMQDGWLSRRLSLSRRLGGYG